MRHVSIDACPYGIYGTAPDILTIPHCGALPTKTTHSHYDISLDIHLFPKALCGQFANPPTNHIPHTVRYRSAIAGDDHVSKKSGTDAG